MKKQPNRLLIQTNEASRCWESNDSWQQGWLGAGRPGTKEKDSLLDLSKRVSEKEKQKRERIKPVQFV